MDFLSGIRSRYEHSTHAEIERAAVSCEVPFHTLLKIVKGETTNPRYKTVEKLRQLAPEATQ